MTDLPDPTDAEKMALAEPNAVVRREPSDAVCKAMIEAIEAAQSGNGAPFKWPDYEHMYDIYVAAIEVAAKEAANQKTCLTCKEIKSLDRFDTYLEAGSKLRRDPHCKECRRAKWRAPEYKAKKAARTAKARVEGRKTASDQAHAAKRRELFPEKESAKSAVRNTLRKGEMVRPAVCESCNKSPPPARGGRSAIQAHHDDYSKPLDVRWLCIACHVAHHAQEKAA